MYVVVVGAGVMGCGLAWRLRLAGARVTVLEKAIPGAEASSAAAGILAPLAEAAHAGPLLDVGLLSRDRFHPEWARALAEATGLDVHLRTCGLVHVATDDAGVVAHDALAGALAAHPHERTDGPTARARWPWLGSTVRDALWLPTEAKIDNQRFVIALHEAAARAGAEFSSGRRVLGLAFAGDRATGVRTDVGLVEGDAIAVCAGAWTSLVGGPLAALGVKPIRGQMLQLQAPAPPFEPVVFAAGRGYLVPRDDGRVLVGSTMEDVGFEKAVTPEGLARLGRFVSDIAPPLAALPVTDTWAGFRPGTPDGLPSIGPVAPGLWVASGHLRNGILLAPITAEILAARLLGRPPPVDASAFDPMRFGTSMA